MVLIRAAVTSALLTTALAVSAAQAGTSKPVPPAKAVKQAEAKLKRLMKEGEDRPSVYESRLELVYALRNLESCDEHDRMEQEPSTNRAWIERTGVPVRVTPQSLYNDLGRTAQARAGCSEDEAAAESFHEAGLTHFARAREAARQGHDALNEAIVLYNAAQSAESIGDLRRAIALMEEVVAIDREYALDDNYREDYPELVRMKDEMNQTETPAEDIEQHLESLLEDKVRFSFKPTHGEQQRYRSTMHDVTWADGQRSEKKMELQYSSVISVKDDLVTVSMQPGESLIDGRDDRSVATSAQAGDLTPENLIAHLLAQPLSIPMPSRMVSRR